MDTGITSQPKYERSPSVASTIATMVLLAGTADIVVSLLQYYWATGKNPTTVLKFIASGIFGKTAFSRGTGMILLGLIFHYAIVLLWTLFFFLTFPIIFPLVKNRWLFALMVALCIWLVMNLAVVPLSLTPPMPFRLQSALISMAILFFAVGLPFSFILHRHYK